MWTWFNLLKYSCLHTCSINDSWSIYSCPMCGNFKNLLSRLFAKLPSNQLCNLVSKSHYQLLKVKVTFSTLCSLDVFSMCIGKTPFSKEKKRHEKKMFINVPWKRTSFYLANTRTSRCTRYKSRRRWSSRRLSGRIWSFPTRWRVL